MIVLVDNLLPNLCLLWVLMQVCHDSLAMEFGAISHVMLDGQVAMGNNFDMIIVETLPIIGED